MKNIHILPTDKPAWLHKSLLSGTLRKSSSCIDDMRQSQGMNIYITSDEEIKKGNEYWFLSKDSMVLKSKNTNENGYSPKGKKIILTTDKDLIADGVQSIDDEFLEWFVNNPSCEEVEVIIEQYTQNYHKDIWYNRHKIIIPKEEPKFGDSINNSINIMSIANSMFGKKEEPKQTVQEYEQQGLEKYSYELEPKQETLEDVAEREASLFYKEGSLDWNKYRQVFIEGAKWQQERSYREEEAGELVYNIIGEYAKQYGIMINGAKLNDLFEQFKKK